MRWVRSAPLRPAAAIRISTSPWPGCGTGRSTRVRASGPPGFGAMIADIVAGTVLMGACTGSGREAPLITPVRLSLGRDGIECASGRSRTETRDERLVTRADSVVRPARAGASAALHRPGHLRAGARAHLRRRLG